MGGGPRVVVSTAAFHAWVRVSLPGLGCLKETKMFLPHPLVNASIVGSLRDRQVACSTSDLLGLHFESCGWRSVWSHHPQEVLIAQFSLHMHKSGLKPFSSARLATPEVVDRPCWNRVESAYWSGDFQKIFFLFDPSLTSGMSVVLMWGHCLRHRPYIKQHMSAGRVAHRKRLRHRPPHLTATCMRVELMESQRRRQRANIKKTFFEKLMNIQYLNLPPYPNRWMVWLIQQGLAWRPRCVKTCCQEDA